MWFKELPGEWPLPEGLSHATLASFRFVWEGRAIARAGVMKIGMLSPEAFLWFELTSRPASFPLRSLPRFLDELHQLSGYEQLFAETAGDKEAKFLLRCGFLPVAKSTIRQLFERKL